MTESFFVPLSVLRSPFVHLIAFVGDASRIAERKEGEEEEANHKSAAYLPTNRTQGRHEERDKMRWGLLLSPISVPQRAIF